MIGGGGGSKVKYPKKKNILDLRTPEAIGFENDLRKYFQGVLSQPNMGYQPRQTFDPMELYMSSMANRGAVTESVRGGGARPSPWSALNPRPVGRWTDMEGSEPSPSPDASPFLLPRGGPMGDLGRPGGEQLRQPAGKDGRPLHVRGGPMGNHGGPSEPPFTPPSRPIADPPPSVLDPDAPPVDPRVQTPFGLLTPRGPHLIPEWATIPAGASPGAGSPTSGEGGAGSSPTDALSVLEEYLTTTLGGGSKKQRKALKRLTKAVSKKEDA